MLQDSQVSFARDMVLAARLAGHVWPRYAAAESCVESAWGSSELCRRALNVFGLKAPHDWQGAVISIPTREFFGGNWMTVDASWPIFESYTEAFRERMQVLRRVSLYAAALAAATGAEFVELVSSHWSTDSNRGKTVLEVYAAHPEIFNQP